MNWKSWMNDWENIKKLSETIGLDPYYSYVTKRYVWDLMGRDTKAAQKIIRRVYEFFALMARCQPDGYTCGRITTKPIRESTLVTKVKGEKYKRERVTEFIFTFHLIYPDKVKVVAITYFVDEDRLKGKTKNSDF